MAVLEIVRLLQQFFVSPTNSTLKPHGYYFTLKVNRVMVYKNPVKENDKPVLEARLLENKRVFVSSEQTILCGKNSLEDYLPLSENSSSGWAHGIL